MKIGEALAEKKRLQVRLAKCNELIKQSYAYTTDKPDFSFEKLQTEIGKLVNKIRKLKLQIQRTNAQIKVEYQDDEYTLAELIIFIADTRSRLATLNDMYKPKDEYRLLRYEEKETKYQVPPEEIQTEISALNEEKTKLDALLQHTNWTTELID